MTLFLCSHFLIRVHWWSVCIVVGGQTTSFSHTKYVNSSSLWLQKDMYCSPLQCIQLSTNHSSESSTHWALTPVFSSLSRRPSMVILMVILCLCSPAARIAILRSASASWHILSPRASLTSRIPISFALKLTPSPKKREGSFLSATSDVKEKLLRWLDQEQ